MAPVALRIEDYGLIGDTQTCALVGRDGSIDWCCLPRFDSAACFAALLGDDRHGFWRIAPAKSPRPGTGPPLTATSRRYRGNSLVLETEFELSEGTVRLVDCMPLRGQHPEIVRLVECTRGEVRMRMDLSIRFEYGSAVPWVRRLDGVLTAIAGPDGLALWSPVHARGEEMRTVAEFTIRENQQAPFVLSWFPSNSDVPRPIDATFAVENTAQWWHDWAELDGLDLGRYQEAVVRSLVTLKALSFAPTGGIIAAATTSLPESLGGGRNWDYRYTWLRDATLTLSALMVAGYTEEAAAWRDWLLRAVAGEPSKLQIMYGPAGERTLVEREIPWLPGYESSAPVRIGNAASDQYQLDVYGEVLGALYEARRVGLPSTGADWDLVVAIMNFLESGWKEPDDGIWEVRGPRRHFTHSKVMAWVAADRAVRAIEEFAVPGPLDRWKQMREDIHTEVCEKGYDAERKTFTQYYGSKELDASVLMIPLMGFLPPKDPRVVGTVEAIQRELTSDGFVMRYDSESSQHVDGLSGKEGAFLACSFWMADDLHLIDREEEAIELFDKLLFLRNDLGLLSEEYDPVAKRQVGNFPQAFSHVSLVNTAVGLGDHATGMSHGDRLQGMSVASGRLLHKVKPHRRHRVGLTD
ncbi:MAG: glycoside hydrolase family 15 protein, partial [Acidimicrobiales bacterium]